MAERPLTPVSGLVVPALIAFQLVPSHFCTASAGSPAANPEVLLLAYMVSMAAPLKSGAWAWGFQEVPS